MVKSEHLVAPRTGKQVTQPPAPGREPLVFTKEDLLGNARKVIAMYPTLMEKLREV
jgi:hypothetical protein